MNTTDLGQKIKELRGQRGWSQIDLGRRMEMTPGQMTVISRWERGVSRPNLMNLYRLAKAFGVSVSEFGPSDQADVEYIGPVEGAQHPQNNDEVADEQSIATSVWLSRVLGSLRETEENLTDLQHTLDVVIQSVRRRMRAIDDELEILAEEIEGHRKSLPRRGIVETTLDRMQRAAKVRAEIRAEIHERERQQHMRSAVDEAEKERQRREEQRAKKEQG